uniref:Putative secreted protein n=1 Tax=Anopheles marajoara TaxID=58244 RepID=A0A2M4CB75_9DIPT
MRPFSWRPFSCIILAERVAGRQTAARVSKYFFDAKGVGGKRLAEFGALVFCNHDGRWYAQRGTVGRAFTIVIRRRKRCRSGY